MAISFIICLLRATNGQMLLGGHYGGCWVGYLCKGRWVGAHSDRERKGKGRGEKEKDN